MKYAKQDTYVLEHVDAGDGDSEPLRRLVKAGDPLPPGMKPETASDFEDRGDGEADPPAPESEPKKK